MIVDKNMPDDYVNRYSPNSFLVRDKVIVMGTMKGHVVSFDLDTGLFSSVSINATENINPVEVVSSGQSTWVLEDAGFGRGRLFDFYDEKLTEIQIMDSNFSPKEDAIGYPASFDQDVVLLASSLRYVYEWQKSSNRLRRIRLKNRLLGHYYLQKMYFDGENFWVGFQNGAQIIPKETMLRLFDEEGEVLNGSPDPCGPFPGLPKARLTAGLRS